MRALRTGIRQETAQLSHLCFSSGDLVNKLVDVQLSPSSVLVRIDLVDFFMAPDHSVFLKYAFVCVVGFQTIEVHG